MSHTEFRKRFAEFFISFGEKMAFFGTVFGFVYAKLSDASNNQIYAAVIGLTFVFGGGYLINKGFDILKLLVEEDAGN